MNRKPIFLIISVLLASTVLVFILFFTSNRNIYKHNSFIRLFPPGVAIISKKMDIKYPSYYIAGVSKDHIYLGNERAGLHALGTNFSLSDTQHIRLSLDTSEVKKLKVVRLAVDSPNFYITDGIAPAIFNGKTSNWIASKSIKESAYFADAVPISNSSYIIKSMSSESREYILGKQTTNVDTIQFAPGILEKQIDGRFCVDGKLHYNSSLAQLVYLYFYRNQYICLDTNMNLLYKGKTIDTISTAKIKVAKIASNNSYTMAAPPLLVNRQSCVYGRWLFVNSNLQAKNEEEDTFKTASVIDVYDLKEGSYKFSFYLDRIHNTKMTTFRVSGNKLVTLNGRYIATFNLTEKYFK